MNADLLYKALTLPHGEHVTPIRVQDVYGKRMYISKEHYENPAVIQIPICTKAGLRRSYTQAGHDHRNTIHRENIKKVIR